MVTIAYLSALCKKKDLMVLFLPQTEQRLNDDQLSRSAPISEFHLLVLRYAFRHVAKHLRPTGRQVWVVADFPQRYESREDLSDYANFKRYKMALY